MALLTELARLLQRKCVYGAEQSPRTLPQCGTPRDSPFSLLPSPFPLPLRQLPRLPVGPGQELARLRITNDNLLFSIPFDLPPHQHGNQAEMPGDGRMMSRLDGRDGRLS